MKYMSNLSRVAGFCLALLLAVATPVLAQELGALSKNGLYRVDLQPPGALAINVLESWIVTVKDSAGAPVEHATIAVTGGMPEHGHGLPTAPQVTAELGDGRYQLDGVKFNMMGHWVIDLDIAAGAERDAVRIELDL